MRRQLFILRLRTPVVKRKIYTDMTIQRHMTEFAEAAEESDL